MSIRKRILFMCVANSARSQLAEALARKAWGPEVEVRSAGSKPTRVNPFAVRVLDEVGLDASGATSKTFDQLPPEFVAQLDWVITLCAEEVCPVVVSNAKKLHWPFSDPAGHEGSEDEQLERFRSAREAIRLRIESFPITGDKITPV